MRIGRLEIWWHHKEYFTPEEKEEFGIIDVPQNLLESYRIINRYSKKTGENHNYLLADMSVRPRNASDDTFKIKRKEKEERKRILEEAQKKARDFKDYQRRERLGLLTPEELERRKLKKEEKNKKWRDKRK